MTQAELAERTGISKNGISKLARNPVMIRIETIEIICKALDVEPGALFRNHSNGPASAR